MKKIITSGIISVLCIVAFAQGFGIDKATPNQKLDVNGWIEVSNESGPGTGSAGTIRYHSSGTLQFHNGSAWVNANVRTTSFTRWGVNSCPSGTSLVYSGIVGGAYYQYGSGANMLCLTNTPNYTSATFSDANQNGALVYGTEFETSGYGISTLTSYHNREAVCAVCLVDNAVVTLMVPGSTQCPSGWTRQYWGYMMALHYTQLKSENVCVDNVPTVFGSTGDCNGALWYPTEAELGALTSPYVQNRELPCSVCTK